MKKLILGAILFSLNCIVPLIADEAPVCHMCEVIREQNKHKVNPYEYYEDYLKAQEAAKTNPPAATPTQSANTTPNKSR